jgi:acyl-[acyl carrier protein]--UDP-N-acetylglucosamine O-acyltransferase
MRPHNPFSSYGGGIHPTAQIGGNPEHRDWRPGDPALYPDIHKTARIEAFVSVDAGMKTPTHIGVGTWLLKHSHVGHDSWIGDDCELTPGVVIGGEVRIGNRVRIGIGSVVRPGVRIGDDARIGCGAVVVCDVPAGEIHVGNPAKKLMRVSEVTDTAGLDTLAA